MIDEATPDDLPLPNGDDDGDDDTPVPEREGTYGDGEPRPEPGAFLGDALAEAAAFRPIVVGALYPTIARGLHADVLAARGLGGLALPVCTTHVVASHGTVTDVLAVPSDTVSAHLEHVFHVAEGGDGPVPTGAKVGVVGDAPTVEAVFRQLERLRDEAPFILDLTLSGPSGEDIVGSGGLDALVERLGVPDLVAVRRTDAELIAAMEIPSLDDAQVAVQRIAQRGARRVLLRCGRIATHFFDAEDAEPPPYAVDLYFDGDAFALFEAPFLEGLGGVHGASSALLLGVLRRLAGGAPMAEALQGAKAYVTEALRACQAADNPVAPRYVLDAPTAS